MRQSKQQLEDAIADLKLQLALVKQHAQDTVKQLGEQRNLSSQWQRLYDHEKELTQKLKEFIEQQKPHEPTLMEQVTALNERLAVVEKCLQPSQWKQPVNSGSYTPVHTVPSSNSHMGWERPDV